MATVVGSLPHQCYDLLIEPFNQGFYNIRDALSGTKVETVAQNRLNANETERELSLIERVSSAVVGIILLVPIINSIAMTILMALKSDFIYPTKVLEQTSQVEEPEETDDQTETQPPPPTPELPIAQIDLSPISPEEMIARKRAALARLDTIENMVRPGRDPVAELDSHFVPHSQILRFNLDQVLQRYQTAHTPAKLFDFINWADIPADDPLRHSFTWAVNPFENLSNPSRQQSTIRALLSNMAEYFEQQQARVTVGSPEEDALKEQFRRVYSSIVDANRNCTDQMLSQVQTLIIDTVAEGDGGGDGVSAQTKIISRAGLALGKYRANLFKEIIVRQNPHQSHMADFERQITQRVAERIGLEGSIFTVGAVYNFTDNDELDRKAYRALETFRQEYKPLQHLLTELQTYYGAHQVLRNELFLWARGYFDFGMETDDDGDPAPANLPDGSPAPHMVARLSEDFDALPASEGGNSTFPALALMLETLGLIRQP
ncbi:MAG: hypothetical protein JSR39_10430 [Verrucomicrobia bacterium]|nr:hypothetical protein [Verrucomicrobiota bacterium]